LLIQDVSDGAHYKPKTGVGWFYEILKNCRIQFFKYCRIKEPPVSVLWKKKKNQTTINSSYVKNLKEPMVFRKESHGSLAGSLTFFYSFCKQHLSYQNQFFEFWENWQVNECIYIPKLITKNYVSHSKNHPTLPKTCITRFGKVLIKSPKHESKVYLGTRSGQGQTKKKGSK
jgi:hypothetical protein